MTAKRSFEDLLADAKRLAANGSLAANTLTRFAGCQSRFTQFCQAQDPSLTPLPATSDTVLLYVVARLTGSWCPPRGKKLLGRSMQMELQGINHAHVKARHPSPITEAVRAVVDGAKRDDPTLTQQLAFTGAELRQRLEAVPPAQWNAHVARLAIAALLTQTGTVRERLQDLFELTVLDARQYEAVLRTRWCLHSSTHDGQVASRPLDAAFLAVEVDQPDTPLFLTQRTGTPVSGKRAAAKVELHLQVLLRRVGIPTGLDALGRLDPVDLDRLLTWADLPQVTFLRDRAVVLGSIGAGLRGSELGHLRWDALEHDDADLVGGRFGWTKTGPDQLWSIKASSTPELCPIAAWRRWQLVSQTMSAWVFFGIGGKGDIRPGGLTASSMRGVMDRVCVDGVEARSSHALRRTTAAMLDELDVALTRIGLKLRHRQLDTTVGYLPGDNDGTAAEGVEL